MTTDKPNIMLFVPNGLEPSDSSIVPATDKKTAYAVFLFKGLQTKTFYGSGTMLSS